MVDTKELLANVTRLGLGRHTDSDAVLEGGPYAGYSHGWYVGRIIVLPWSKARWSVYIVQARPPRTYEASRGNYPGAAVFKGFASSEKNGKALDLYKPAIVHKSETPTKERAIGSGDAISGEVG